MASRVLKFETESFRIKQLTDASGSVLVNRLQQQACSAADSRPSSELGPEGGNFAKGCLAGLGMEFGAAVAIYGLWQLWHFFR